MIEGAAVLLAGLVIGYLAGRSRGRASAPPAPKAIEAMCSCNHPRGQHVDGKGACKAENTFWTPDNWNVFRPCACQLYDGPEPLPQFYAPEIQS
jgi:hypothetical protein